MWYDLVILAILGYSALRGAARGLVWQLAWISALVLCFAFAESFSMSLAPHIKVDPPLNRWIAMFILYVGFSFLSFGMARAVRGAIEQAKFEEFDRHLGGLFGLAKGVVFGIVLTFFVVTLSESLRPTVLASYSGHYAAVIMTHLEPVMPAELQQVLEPHLQTLDPNHRHDSDFHSDSPLQIGEGLPDNSDPFDLRDLLPNRPATGAEEKPAGGWGGFGFNFGGGEAGQPAVASGLAGQPTSLNEMLNRLPSAVGRELRDAAVNAYRNATPAQQQQLLRDVERGMPDQIRSTLDKINGAGLFDDRTQPIADNGPARQGGVSRLGQVLGEISSVYSDAPQDRRQIEADVRNKLTGVPEQIGVAVLDDWYADLLAEGTDPDPGTSFSTDLDVRILRQLSAARIPIERLSSQLQQRLRDAQRQ